MNKKLFFPLFLFLSVLCFGVFCIDDANIPEKPFVFVIASYKNIEWYKKNIDSIMMQDKTYSNWRAIYIDDCSPDRTGEAVQQYVKECGFEDKITVIRNEVRVGALANLYNAIHSCADDEIICTLDGDDWIAVDNLFCILNGLYSDPNVWLTYGQYKEVPSGKVGCSHSIPKSVIDANAFRDIPWVTSHLRTFYAWLFKKIKKEDLMFNGNFFSMTWDLAIMYPMLEMAGERIRFNPTVVYEYNMENPINDFKKDLDLVLRLNKLIRKKQRYQRLPIS